MSNGTLSCEDTGEIINIPGDCYIPQVNLLLILFIQNMDFNIIDSNTMEINIVCKVTERYEGVLNNMFEKEVWKKEIINCNLCLDDQMITPIASLISDNNYVIYPDEVQVFKENNKKIDSYLDTKTGFLFDPESYPRMKVSPPGENQNYILFWGLHNILYINVNELKSPFTIKYVVHNYSNTFFDDGFKWVIPIIFPFGTITVEKFLFNSNNFILETKKSNIDIYDPRISKKLWGLESAWMIPLDEELVKHRLIFGNKLDNEIAVADINDIDFTYPLIRCISFNLYFKASSEIVVNSKVSKYPVPLALYEHLDRIIGLNIPLATSFVTNLSVDAITIHASSIIEGLTYEEINTINIPPMSQVIINHKPHLSNNLNKMETCELGLKLTISKITSNGVLPIYYCTHNIRILAKDTMIWHAILPNGNSQNIAQYIACWVTPHIPEIDDLITKAAKRHPQKCFQGYQNCIGQPEVIDKQVKAIYEEISAIPLTYISRSISFGGNNYQASQRVLKPELTIKNSGNCIDLTVLMASALENIGINPIIVLVPGHAFLGWEIESGKESYHVLECTCIEKPFDIAMDVGQQTFNKYFNQNSINADRQIVNIRKMRAKNVFPLIY